jgi:DNA-binding MarR family transcriptional regulator
LDQHHAFRVSSDFEQEFPGTSASAAECMLNLVRAGLAAVACLQRFLADFDLGPQPFNVLAILGGAGAELTPHEISERLLVPRSTLTSVLDGLERRGLVVRRPHPGHRSMVDVAITPAGEALLAELLPRLHAREAEWFAWLAEEDRRSFIRILGEAHANFRGGGQGGDRQ